MKKRVALVYGGRSVEHEISIRSAKNIASNIDRSLFELIVIGIDKNGEWFLCDRVADQPSNGIALTLRLNATNAAFMRLDNHTRIEFDIVFPIVHGTDGEDGGIQGLFRTLGKPVIGSDVLGSAVSMDKTVSKKILENSGIPVVPYLICHAADKDQLSFESIKEKLGLPFIVKAGDLGSSVGINKVSSFEQFAPAIADSCRFSSILLIESFIKCREMECGILGNENPEATLPGEIVLKKNYDFYTYEAKYEDEDAIDIKIPANAASDVHQKIMKHCVDAFLALRCNDFARVDVFLTDENEIYINEINTLPGFTNVSMFPMLWQNMGLEYPALITRLINLAEHRWLQMKQLEKSYK